MATNKLTDTQVKNAKPKAGEYLLSDGDRLSLRIRPDGEKHWFFIYTFESKRIKSMIGSYPAISIAEARSQAESCRELLAKGINPKQRKLDDEIARQERIKADALATEAVSRRITVNKLFNRWEMLDLVNRKDKGKEIRRMFEKDVLPVIGSMAVEDVRKPHIVEIIDALLLRGVTRMSKLMLSLIRQMFRFAQDRDIIENDPTSSIRKAKIGGKDTVRERHLSEAEIKEFTSKLQGARLLKSSECALWIMLSTCCRVGEIMKSKWTDLDLDAKTWKIPAENSKNGKPHVIYLSEFAINQFNQLTSISKSNIWIFPNTDNTNHVCEKSISKQVGDRQLSEQRLSGKGRLSGRSTLIEALKLSGGKWTPHDLRRTGATVMGDLGIRPDVIEKCLNHIEQNKMIKTYQHQALIPERVQAWKLLGERIELLTSENINNVITINPAKAHE